MLWAYLILLDYDFSLRKNDVIVRDEIKDNQYNWYLFESRCDQEDLMAAYSYLELDPTYVNLGLYLAVPHWKTEKLESMTVMKTMRIHSIILDGTF